nr:MAG TPA: protein of unknown function DUF3310 [Caudoviricetes sp.]
MKIVKLPSLSKQVGGNHYKNKHYELAQFSLDVGLSPMIHSAIKYILRDKTDKAEDLEKAQHCVTIFRDWVYCNSNLNPRILNNFNTNMDFNLVSTFLTQFEAHEQAAMLAIIQLQAEVKVFETVSEDFTTNVKADTDLLLANYKNAIEHIERLK